MVKSSISFFIERENLQSASQYAGDVHADLTRMVKVYQDLANEYGDFVSVMIFEMQRHPNLLDLAKGPLEIVFAFIELIARYQKEGLLAKEHPLVAWASLVSPVIIAFNMKRVVPDLELRMDDFRDHVANFLAGRLKKTKKP